MQRGEILRKERLNHLAKLSKLGVDAYPANVQRTNTAAEALASHGQKVKVAGRIIAIRSHGKAMFLDLVDKSAKIQAYAKAEELGDLFRALELLDVGDFLLVHGLVFTTKMGEVTIHVESAKVLAKAIRPLPSEWYGLKDTEERYRHRYLDLILNPEVKAIFEIRAGAIQAIRHFMLDHGFMEVDTPILQPLYGGASAQPFVTHYNFYDSDVYLRVAPELYLKRLLVGGYEKVFEFARCFRNEGADATHNPEFTQIEFYAAYWDETELMTFTEELIAYVVSQTLGKEEITIEGQAITITRPFDRVTFAELTHGKMDDATFKEAVKKLVRPTFVTNHPRYLVPLAKSLDKDTARSFQLVIGGVEVVKAFSELNDPLDQRSQFEEQMKRREKGDHDAQVLDEDFLEAMEYGMPPAAGFGMGIDRFVTLLAGQHALRQALFFPFMKSKNKVSSSKIKIDASKAKERK